MPKYVDIDDLKIAVETAQDIVSNLTEPASRFNLDLNLIHVKTAVNQANDAIDEIEKTIENLNSISEEYATKFANIGIDIVELEDEDDETRENGLDTLGDDFTDACESMRYDARTAIAAYVEAIDNLARWLEAGLKRYNRDREDPDSQSGFSEAGDDMYNETNRFDDLV